MSTLSFIAEEREIKKAERKLARKKKLIDLWCRFAMWSVPWLTPVFMAAVAIVLICLGIWIFK